MSSSPLLSLLFFSCFSLCLLPSLNLSTGSGQPLLFKSEGHFVEDIRPHVQCVLLHGSPAAVHGLVVGSRTAGDSSPAVARSRSQGRDSTAGSCAHWRVRWRLVTMRMGILRSRRRSDAMLLLLVVVVVSSDSCSCSFSSFLSFACCSFSFLSCASFRRCCHPRKQA